MTTAPDLPDLLARLQRIKELTDLLNAVQHNGTIKTAAIERLGLEIDAVRKVLRPQLSLR